MRTQPHFVKCIDWRADVRKARFLRRLEIDKKPSVKICGICHDEGYKSQGQIGHHTLSASCRLKCRGNRGLQLSGYMPDD